jgi:hypothetical protein
VRLSSESQDFDGGSAPPVTRFSADHRFGILILARLSKWKIFRVIASTNKTEEDDVYRSSKMESRELCGFLLVREHPEPLKFFRGGENPGATCMIIRLRDMQLQTPGF